MKTPKRIFIGLLALSLLTIIALLALGYLIVVYRGNLLSRIMMVIGAMIILFLGLMAFGVFTLIVTLWSAKAHPSLQNLMLAAVNLLFPLALSLGKIFNIEQEKIKRSFISVNNELVRNREFALQPQEILILAPHCIQWSNCPYKITIDVENCKRCGKCTVSDLHGLKDTYHVKLAIASGGTLARKFVKEFRPKAIVAIACERDLTSGIQETSPLPVLGIVNQRPFEPCFNTTVDLALVEEAIRYYLHHYTGTANKTSIDTAQLGIQNKNHYAVENLNS